MKKTLITILATVLVCGCLVGGTLAWLTATSDTVVNTFTIGNIAITLTETDSDGDGNKLANSYKMVPGSDIDKDPTVSVAEGSESCWLFVKVTEANNTFGAGEKYITYTPAEGWETLEPGVYYREVGANDNPRSFSVFDGDKVTVNGNITKDEADALNRDGAGKPTLSVIAYAIQRENFDNVATAWAEFDTND